MTPEKLHEVNNLYRTIEAYEKKLRALEILQEMESGFLQIQFSRPNTTLGNVTFDREWEDVTRGAYYTFLSCLKTKISNLKHQFSKI